WLRPKPSLIHQSVRRQRTNRARKESACCPVRFMVTIPQLACSITLVEKDGLNFQCLHVPVTKPNIPEAGMPFFGQMVCVAYLRRCSVDHAKIGTPAQRSPAKVQARRSYAVSGVTEGDHFGWR